MNTVTSPVTTMTTQAVPGEIVVSIFFILTALVFIYFYRKKSKI